MQPMTHQVMGYDRAITMFSPDGRLLQVEYAKKTVKQGSTAIGLTCSDGIVLVTDKRIVDTLVVPESVEKIFKIDDHIAATASGILSDARILVERAQIKAQQHQVTFDSPTDTLSIVKDICNVKQFCTQTGGLRPFGVSLIIAGVDQGKPHLFETDPTGIFFEYKATVIGEGEVEIEDILHKEYRENMTLDEGMKLAVKALVKTLDNKFGVERLDCAYITAKEGMFKRLSRQELDNVLKQMRKKDQIK